jgi:hypothetical protein
MVKKYQCSFHPEQFQVLKQQYNEAVANLQEPQHKEFILAYKNFYNQLTKIEGPTPDLMKIVEKQDFSSLDKLLEGINDLKIKTPLQELYGKFKTSLKKLDLSKDINNFKKAYDIANFISEVKYDEKQHDGYVLDIIENIEKFNILCELGTGFTYNGLPHSFNDLKEVKKLLQGKEVQEEKNYKKIIKQLSKKATFNLLNFFIREESLDKIATIEACRLLKVFLLDKKDGKEQKSLISGFSFGGAIAFKVAIAFHELRADLIEATKDSQSALITEAKLKETIEAFLEKNNIKNKKTIELVSKYFLSPEVKDKLSANNLQ